MDVSDGLGEASQRAEGWAGASPVAVPPVLAGAQEVLASPVVGVLVEHPVALHHVEGGDVAGVEALHQVGAVLRQLHVLTQEVGALEHLDLVVATVLEKRRNDA